MLAKYILGVLGLTFLVLGATRLGAEPARRPQGQVWLLLGTIFAVVSVWLFVQALR